jgi:hypothetical protein
MGYLGYKPADKPLTSADITDSIITSAKIVDGTIANADINSSAAIALTKLASTGTLTVDNIQFPATQVASANANNLDDYEEGTWTPSYSGGVSSITYGTVRAGGYTKIGNLVTINLVIMTDGLTVGSGDVTITGLPFTSKSGSSAETGGAGSFALSDATRFVTLPPSHASVGKSSTTITLYSSINATGSGVDTVKVQAGNLSSGSSNRNILALSGSYFT